MVLLLKEEKQIQKNKLDLSWDYAKQQNDIHCRLYLQFFVVYLTIGVTIALATLVDKLNSFLFIVSIIFFLVSFYYIIRIRTLPDELQKSWEYIINELENLK